MQARLFITPENQIYSGDKFNDVDRELEPQEVLLYNRGYGYDIEDGKLLDISTNPEYLQGELNKAKTIKLQELETALQQKSSGLNSCLTINLPATLKKGDETKQVTSYKLLTNTSAGPLLTILSNMKDLPAAFLADALVTQDGYTVVGLSQEIEMLGLNQKQIYFIWISVMQAQAKITEYLRGTKEDILACADIDEVNAIEINFDAF